jgi:endonuclease-3 related protein
MRADDAALRLVYRRLFRRFGPQRWWPARTPWEMMVGAILTQNTAWTNVERAIRSLRRARVLSLVAIATLPRRRLERLIRSSGYFRQKAERLQRFARALRRDSRLFRQLTGRERAPSLLALRRTLLTLPGIGPETADSILLYAGGYPTFVVDAYTRRLLSRIGLFRSGDYDALQAFFHERCAASVPLYKEFHALIVALAKSICTSRRPRCAVCPVSDLCAYFKRAQEGAAESTAATSHEGEEPWRN